MKRMLLLSLSLCCLSFAMVSSAAVRVLSPVNGIPTSNKFKVAIAESKDGNYINSHVHYTEEQGYLGEGWGYSNHIKGYDMSYVNFEFKDNAVWVRVIMPGKDIPDLVVRPAKKNAVVNYEQNSDGLRIA